MVRAELREANIEAIGMQSISDMADALANGVAPSLIVVDGAELETLAARKMLEDLARTVGVLVVDSRTTPAPALPGADVLSRPVRVRDITSWVFARLSRKTD